jgi:hypothetical protein
MPSISINRLQAYRAQTYRTAPGLRITTRDEAIDYVNRRGFIFFWPIHDVDLPSLWTAVAGDRPVPDEHDDPGHITWDWKDSLLGARRWYYARILRRRNTIVSFDVLPYFYALSPNYGDYENDYLDLYALGQLTPEAKSIFEALLHEGPLDTLTLKREAHLSNPTSEGRFNRGLDELQSSFRILPVGISQAGAWKYAFIYDITARYYPWIDEKSRPIQENDARIRLIKLAMLSCGAAKEKDLMKLFSWKANQVQKNLAALVQKGELTGGLEYPGQTGEWYAIPDLAD